MYPPICQLKKYVHNLYLTPFNIIIPLLVFFAGVSILLVLVICRVLVDAYKQTSN